MLPSAASTGFRRLGLAVLLLSLPACGLSEYESLMQKAKERTDRFQDEQKYLDAPVSFPMEKDKEGNERPLATVFFRPPKGIDSKPKEQPLNNILWQYLPRRGGSDFAEVDMAFDEGYEDFVGKVVHSYPTSEGVPVPEHKPPWPFDSWEYNDSQFGYSINIYKGGAKKIAIVYLFRREKRNDARKAIDLSLQTLIDNTARQRYNQKMPWKLDK